MFHVLTEEIIDPWLSRHQKQVGRIPVRHTSLSSRLVKRRERPSDFRDRAATVTGLCRMAFEKRQATALRLQVGESRAFGSSSSGSVVA